MKIKKVLDIQVCRPQSSHKRHCLSKKTVNAMELKDKKRQATVPKTNIKNKDLETQTTQKSTVIASATEG